MKKLLFPLALSLGIHGMGMFAADFSGFSRQEVSESKEQKELVHFSYTNSDLKEHQSIQQAKNTPLSAVKTSVAVNRQSQDLLNDKMMQRIRRLVDRQIKGQKEITDKTSLVKSSAEVLADPKTKKVFTAYFMKIRERVYRSAMEESEKSPAKRMRSATLEFVLASDGSLLRVGSVLNDGTKFLSETDIFAQHCLKVAAPFDAFPKEILFKKIAFNITLIFEE